jgi:y4mF family transcriptional regulator
MISLAQIVKNHRKKAGLSQAQLAKLAGVGKTVVWDIEHGKKTVQWDTLQKIFRVVNITVEWRSPLLDRMASLASVPAPTADGPPSLSKPPASETSAVASRISE